MSLFSQNVPVFAIGHHYHVSVTCRYYASRCCHYLARLWRECRILQILSLSSAFSLIRMHFRDIMFHRTLPLTRNMQSNALGRAAKVRQNANVADTQLCTYTTAPCNSCSATKLDIKEPLPPSLSPSPPLVLPPRNIEDEAQDGERLART